MNDFCDSYIEFAKYNMNDSTKSVLLRVLKTILKLLHPFMPYVTDELYDKLPLKNSENIMISSYPKYDKEFIFNDAKKEVDDIINFITLFRNIKAENNITKDYKVCLNNDYDYSFVAKMLKFEDKIISEKETKKEYIVKVNNLNISIFFEKEITKEDEEILAKQIESLKMSIERRKNLLANENYVSKAPSNLVEQERQKLAEEIENLEALLNN